MKISANGLAIVRAFEGCHRAVPGKPGYFAAYLDPVGIPTIGFGHTNHHLPKFDGNAVWSQAKCDEVLALDMERFERHVEKLAKVPLAQHEFDALVSWSFNTGGPSTATLWKKLNAGNKAAIPAELAKWNKAGGKALAGLTRRRKSEGELFAGKIAAALATAHAKKPPSTSAPKPSEPLVTSKPKETKAPEPLTTRSLWADLLAAVLYIFKRGLR